MRTLLLTTVVMLVAATGADAATVQLEGDRLHYAAAPGELNDLRFEPAKNDDVTSLPAGHSQAQWLQRQAVGVRRQALTVAPSVPRR